MNKFRKKLLSRLPDLISRISYLVSQLLDLRSQFSGLRSHISHLKSILYRALFLALSASLLSACGPSGQKQTEQRSGQKQEERSSGEQNLLRVSDNHHFFAKGDEPFFWLGDTGWLLFRKLNREEAEQYLEDRKQKGFNVIQVMVLHSLDVVNSYGDSALTGRNVAAPKTTEGSSFEDSLQYDYWDHVDFIIDKAAEKDIYMALVPVWGTNVKEGGVSRKEARNYAGFLAERYKDRPNIVWLNGGDTFGSDSTATWNIIGNMLNEKDTTHLITFHPFGRTQSSAWFHNEEWLDFNMFQSGHRRYDQDNEPGSLQYGPDNWRYVRSDYNKTPVKPVLDGEPSYEGLPQGLHDPAEPYWDDDDLRRYGYWSVFAGACGFTYGHSAVMQMHKPGDEGAYGVKDYWYDAIDHPGAMQMIHLKELILSRPYFERVPDQSLIAANPGEKYDHQMATRGKDYAFIYTWNGRDIAVNMGKIGGEEVKASWYNPRDGSTTEIGVFPNKGTKTFDPPGQQADGNDWVLVLDKA